MIYIILVFIIISSFMTLSFYKLLDRNAGLLGAESMKTVNASLIVGDRIGLNADPNVLDYGIVMPGNSAKRSINVTNTHQYPVQVKLSKSGNISKFLNLEDSDMVPPNSSEEIFIDANVPLNAPFESYSGEVRIEIFPKRWI